MPRKRLNATEARALAAEHEIPLDSDFHALPSRDVSAVIAAADARGYRRPVNANGNRARCFYAYLQRAAGS